jgi:hypothetical protein
LRRVAWGPLALAAAALGAGCGEQLESGTACPLLCPEQNVVVQDTVIEPVVLDTSIAGYPLRGTENRLLLAARGDTFETRVVIRFDSTYNFFRTISGDSQVTHIDSPYVKLRIDRARSLIPGSFTLEVFDVDTIVGDSLAAQEDTSTALEVSLFKPERLIGTVTLDSSAFRDSIRVLLDSATVERKILERERLRLGLRVRASASVVLYFYSKESEDSPVLRYDPSPDTAVKPLTVFPMSKTPRSQPVVASDLADYVHVVVAPPDPPWPLLGVGGARGRRILLRFDIPARIVDSSNVLRATLLLSQVPLRDLDDTGRVVLYPHLVTAGPQVQDPGRVAYLITAAGSGFDSLVVAPQDSGVRAFEIVNALRAWGLSGASTQRALVLRATLEGLDHRRVAFYSREAPPELRPRLRISYSLVQRFGIP